MYVPNIPLFNEDPADWYTQHIPRGHDLEKQLKQVTSQYIKGVNLPITKQNLANEQRLDHQFKDIYDYIMHNVLPGTKRVQKRILSKAEDFVIVDCVIPCKTLRKRKSPLKHHTKGKFPPYTRMHTIKPRFHSTGFTSCQ